MRNTGKSETAENLANTLIVQKKITSVQEAELLTNDAMRANQVAVKQMAETVLATITDDTFLASFGPEVQTLCANIYDATARHRQAGQHRRSRKPTTPTPNSATRSSASSVLLRLINPTLTDEATGAMSEAARRETAAQKQLEEANKLPANDPSKAETVRLAQQAYDRTPRPRARPPPRTSITMCCSRSCCKTSRTASSPTTTWLPCTRLSADSEEPIRVLPLQQGLVRRRQDGARRRRNQAVDHPHSTTSDRTESDTADNGKQTEAGDHAVGSRTEWRRVTV